jgi:hypothetical protein
MRFEFHAGRTATEGRSIDRRPVQVKHGRSSIDIGCRLADAELDGAPRCTGPVAVQPRDRNQNQKELLQVSNEETPETEQTRAQPLAMRAGGRKKAAGKKAAGKKGTGRKKSAGKKGARKSYGKKAAGKKGGRATAAKKAAGKKGGRKKAAGRKKTGGRRKAAAAAAPASESMPSNGPDSMD